MGRYTVEIEIRRDEKHPAIIHATSVSGPKWLRSYHVWHTDRFMAVAGVKNAIQAVFPEHEFMFTERAVTA